MLLLLQRTPDPNLSGWAGIEDHLMTHDDAAMSDYADDIDTMLVFVSLHPDHSATDRSEFAQGRSFLSRCDDICSPDIPVSTTRWYQHDQPTHCVPDFVASNPAEHASRYQFYHLELTFPSVVIIPRVLAMDQRTLLS